MRIALAVCDNEIPRVSIWREKASDAGRKGNIPKSSPECDMPVLISARGSDGHVTSTFHETSTVIASSLLMLRPIAVSREHEMSQPCSV
jgi:hypothetical protein